MFRTSLKLCLGAALVAFVACAPSRLSVREMNVSSPSLMIARKSPRPAYLVLDPARVPAVMPVLVDNTDRGGRLEDVHAFVERDLKKAFSNYFDRVEVVGPDFAFPPEPHVVIDVKMERVEVRVGGTSGGVTHGLAAMTWGLGLRLTESSDYLYSFAGESAGSPTGNVNVVFRSMFESAITDMLKGYTEKEIHAKILDAATPSVRPAGATEI